MPHLCPPTDAEEETLLEREVLAHSLRRGRTQKQKMEGRAALFWSRVAAQDQQDDLWIAAQDHVWAEQSAAFEQACLQPLSTCIAELRRWQGVQRAAHERKCAQVKTAAEVEEGNLQWAIFCARLAHDSCGQLSVTALSPEQTRFCDASAGPQLQPRAKAKEQRVFSVVRGDLGQCESFAHFSVLCGAEHLRCVR